MSKINEKRNQLGKLFKQMEEIGEKVKDEQDGKWTKEDHDKFDKLDKDFSELEKEIEAEERLADLTKKKTEKATEIEKTLKVGDLSPEEKEKRQSRIFLKYLAFGENRLTPDEKEFYDEQFNIEKVKNMDPNVRALTTQTGATGGVLIPQGFADQINIARKAYGGMRQACEARNSVITTETGNDIIWPTSNDGDGPINPHTGAWLAENTQGTEKDIPFSSKTVEAWTVYSRIVRVPVQLMQDAFNASGFNIESFIGRTLGTRIGRTENLAFTTGDGSSKPHGLVTDMTHLFNSADDATISFNDYIGLEGHCDPEYRRDAAYMLNDATLTATKKLSVGSSDARPIWQPSFREGTPPQINGYPYFINQDMAGIGSGNKSLIFGDFGDYIIRDALGMQLLVLRERYADYLQVGFIAYARTDGIYLNPGTRDLVILRHVTT